MHGLNSNTNIDSLTRSAHWRLLASISAKMRCSTVVVLIWIKAGLGRVMICVLRQEMKGRAMEIEGTQFGSITIDRKTYEHDVVIRLSGEVIKRKKKLSKKYYGTSHVLSKDEAKFVFEKGCEQLIIGSGQMGNVHLSPEAEAYFAKKACKVLLQPTPDAIGVFNKSQAKKIGLFHVTC
jgi:hypothetical protein